MKKSALLAPVIDQLLEKNTPFVSWFSPGENTPRLIISTSDKVKYLDSVAELTRQQGFVLAPFAVSSSFPVVLLQPEITLQGIEQVAAFDFAALPAHGSLPSFEKGKSNENIIATKDDYMACIVKAIAAIDAGEFSKVVFSRCSYKERKGESLGQLFLLLQQKSPQVFVYIANIPGVGLWMGATPETLLAIDGDYARTVSLAGTQALRPDGNYCWFAKEIEEQAFVSRYAVDILNRYGISGYSTRGPENLETAAVAHLKTTFTFPAENIADKLGDFVADLSPTPAVCGLPKESARKFILLSEPHDRRYYSGFLGCWNMAECPTHLFVNLRCMEVGKEGYFLYTGGGITAKSSPAKEWEETNHKAQTLLAVVDSLQG